MNIPFSGSSIPFFPVEFCGGILGQYLHSFTSILCHIPHGQLQQATV